MNAEPIEENRNIIPIHRVPDGQNAFAEPSCSHTLRHLLLATTTHTTTAGGKLLLFRERSY